MQAAMFSVNGCDLHTEESGEGPPVLLIHGAGAFAGLFEPCVRLLEPRFRVLSYDRRACSRSVHPPVRDFADHVSDAAALLADRVGAPALVVGWSAGTVVALRLAMTHPEAVSGLVLAEPPFSLHAPRPAALGAVARWEWARLRHGATVGAEVFYRWVSQYRGEGNAFDAYPEAWRAEMLGNAEALFSEIRFGGGAMGEGISRRMLRSLAVPTTILVGERSAPIFPPAARFVAKAIPGCDLVPVPGASHMIPTDAPELVAEQVVRRAERLG